MSYAYFVIFRQGRQARASRFVIPAGRDWPSAFRYEGRTYLSSGIALCNGDHFFDASGELVGFSFLFGGDTEVGRGRLAKECVNVEITPSCWLKFILAESRSYQHDGCQRIYPFVYADEHSDHMVLVQECPQCWTALGFRLASPPLPEAVF
jgi:hypothetical protein